jgi:peptidoglycan/LPS O-acetylase OafA/YrhL
MQKMRQTIPALDGFRAIAVLIVLISHAGYRNIVPGGLGVTIFFFLSGYLITSLLVDEFAKTNNLSIKKFLLRRFYRLFLAFLLCLLYSYSLVMLGWLGGGVSIEGFLSQLFYLANYHLAFDWQGSIPDGTDVLWSLAVEEHFYLVFPFLILLGFKKLNKYGIASCILMLCIFSKAKKSLSC